MNEQLNFHHLRSAQETFERFRINMENDQHKAGAVHAFERCYELTWKMMKRTLSLRKIETGSPKDTFHKAALEKIIDDPEIWFEFLEKRSLTLDIYEKENLDAIVAIFDIFSLQLDSVITRMQKIVKQ